MLRTRKPATLFSTLSVRIDDATFARLVEAANRHKQKLGTSNYRLSDFVRMLLERAELAA